MLKQKRLIATISMFVLLFSFSITPVSASTTVNESESNNTYSLADTTKNDYDNNGTLSSSSDIDWWSITFASNGLANFWVGNITSSFDIDLQLYESDGSTLIAASHEIGGGSSELIRARVYPGITYLIKVFCLSGSLGSTNYLLRAKNYSLNPAKIYTSASGSEHTTDTYTKMSPYLTSMGYATTNYSDNTASSAYNAIPSCDIAFFNNHAQPGIMGFYNSYLFATATNSQLITSYDRTLSSYSYEALSEVDLIVFAGCYSGLSSSSYGNLADMAVNKGAMCSFGWNQEIYTHDSILWNEQFAYNLSCGYNVLFAINYTNSWADGEVINTSRITDIYTAGTPFSLTLG